MGPRNLLQKRPAVSLPSVHGRPVGPFPPRGRLPSRKRPGAGRCTRAVFLRLHLGAVPESGALPSGELRNFPVAEETEEGRDLPDLPGDGGKRNSSPFGMVFVFLLPSSPGPRFLSVPWAVPSPFGSQSPVGTFFSPVRPRKGYSGLRACTRASCGRPGYVPGRFLPLCRRGHAHPLCPESPAGPFFSPPGGSQEGSWGEGAAHGLPVAARGMSRAASPPLCRRGDASFPVFTRPAGPFDAHPFCP